MTANEHTQSQAVQLEGFPLPFDSSKAFPQAAGAQWNIFHSTLCMHDYGPPHQENVTVVTCVECGFVSHLIGGKMGIATFFHIKVYILEVAIEHTHPHFHPGGGDSGLYVSIRQSHEIKPSIPKRHNHLAFQPILIFPRDMSVCDNVKTLHTMTDCPSLEQMGWGQKAGAKVFFSGVCVL